MGTIRDGFNQFSSLDFVDMSNNQFEGSLPASIFDIPTLRIVYFNNNDLDGPIPANYGTSPVLRDLFLSGNSLTGTIPDIEPGQLLELTEFLVNGNALEGTMPPSVCQLRLDGILDDLWADCGPTASPVLECDFPECCTLCFPTEAGVIPQADITQEKPLK